MVDFIAILCLCFAVACLIVTVVAIRRSRYRVGQTPRCRRCEYILVTPGGRCPECGTELSPDQVVYGERRRSVVWATAGGVALIGAVILSMNAARHVDWYRLLPMAWLMHDLNSPSAQAADRAWEELDRRYGVGSLSAGQRAKVIDLCLAEQISPVKGRLRQGMLDLLYTQAARRQLTPDQEAKFYEGVPDVTLRTPAKIPAGKPVPCTLIFNGRGPSGVQLDQWWRSWDCRFDHAPLLLDGVPTGQTMGGGGVSGDGASGSEGTGIQPPSVGHHVLAIDLPILITLSRENPDAAGEETRASFTRHLTAAFDVLPAPTTATRP